jgi:hypothetical protein
MHTVLQNSILRQYLEQQSYDSCTLPQHRAVRYSSTAFRRNTAVAFSSGQSRISECFPPPRHALSMISSAKQRALLIERHTKSFILTFYQNFPVLDVPAGRCYSRSGRDMHRNCSIRYWQRKTTRKCVFLRNKSKDVFGMFSCTICSHSECSETANT